jgi:hypothetical protein
MVVIGTCLRAAEPAPKQPAGLVTCCPAGAIKMGNNVAGLMAFELPVMGGFGAAWQV